MSDGEIPPQLFTHCVQVWDSMNKNATETHEGLAWSGALTRLLTDLGITQGNYTAITAKLIAMGCISQYQRGAGNSPSIWLIGDTPTYDNYVRAQANTIGQRLKPKADKDNLLRQLADRVGTLELVVRKLGEKLKQLEENQNANH